MLSHNTIKFDDIIEVLRNSNRILDPKIPFPQADVFSRVVALLGLLVERDLTTDEVTLNDGFDARQAYYCADAAMYLGLVTGTRRKGPRFIPGHISRYKGIMVILGDKAYGKSKQFHAVDEAIRTAQFLRNKALRDWMENKGVGKYDLSKYCTVLAAEFPFADKLN